VRESEHYVDTEERLAIIDTEHLRLLGLGYYLSAAMTAFFSLFGLLYMGIGMTVTKIAHDAPRADAPPEAMGLVFALIGAAFFLIMAGITGIKAYVGRCLERRRHRVLCLVVAVVSCLEIPYGTALGIGTFIVLMRPRVMRQFDGTLEPRAC
jgi:hypothetical protein